MRSQTLVTGLLASSSVEELHQLPLQRRHCPPSMAETILSLTIQLRCRAPLIRDPEHWVIAEAAVALGCIQNPPVPDAVTYQWRRIGGMPKTYQQAMKSL